MEHNVNLSSMKYMIFVSMVFLSAFVANILLSYDKDLMFLCIDQVEELCQSGFSVESYIYILFKRIKQCFLLIVIANYLPKNYFQNIIWSIAGIGMGAFLVVQSYYIGIVGVIELIILLFPHYILYFIIIDYFVIHEQEKMKRNKIKYSIIILALLLLGVFCEQIVSKFFLLNYYQYIVTNNS